MAAIDGSPRIVLLDLPAELLEAIVSNVRRKDLLPLSLVCTTTSRLAQEKLFYHCKVSTGKSLAGRLERVISEPETASQMEIRLLEKVQHMCRSATVDFNYLPDDTPCVTYRSEFAMSFLQTLPNITRIHVNVNHYGLKSVDNLPDEQHAHFRELLRYLRSKQNMRITRLCYSNAYTCNHSLHTFFQHMSALPAASSMVDLLALGGLGELFVQVGENLDAEAFSQYLQHVSLLAPSHLSVDFVVITTAWVCSSFFPSITSVDLTIRLAEDYMGENRTSAFLRDFISRCPNLQHARLTSMVSAPEKSPSTPIFLPSLVILEYRGPSPASLCNKLEAPHLRSIVFLEYQSGGCSFAEVLPVLCEAKLPKLSKIEWVGQLYGGNGSDFRSDTTDVDACEPEAIDENGDISDESYGNAQTAFLASSPFFHHTSASHLVSLDYLKLRIIPGFADSNGPPTLAHIAQWLRECSFPNLRTLRVQVPVARDYEFMLEIAHAIGRRDILPELQEIRISAATERRTDDDEATANDCRNVKERLERLCGSRVIVKGLGMVWIWDVQRN